MGITINITEGINDYEFYNVPEKVAKAIITLLHECEKDDSTIVSAVSERLINQTTDPLAQSLVNFCRKTVDEYEKEQTDGNDD